MRVTLDELNVAELRALCRQHKLPETYDADDMRDRLRQKQHKTTRNSGQHIRPCTLKEARRYVNDTHRHNNAPQGGMFAAKLVDDHGQTLGVVIAGRPVARALDDGLTIEVTRLSTAGTRNACSRLYAAVTRAATALGYERAYTYTLATEPGTSLKAAGWQHDAHLPPRPTWDAGERHRVQQDLFGNETRPAGPKQRWVKHLQRNGANTAQ